jgi:hypothetical protein
MTRNPFIIATVFILAQYLEFRGHTRSNAHYIARGIVRTAGGC